MEGYFVADNIRGSIVDFEKATHVIAFHGTEIFVIKSRTGPCVWKIPTKPDMVVAYFSNPPEIKELQLREST